MKGIKKIGKRQKQTRKQGKIFRKQKNHIRKLSQPDSNDSPHGYIRISHSSALILKTLEFIVSRRNFSEESADKERKIPFYVKEKFAIENGFHLDRRAFENFFFSGLVFIFSIFMVGDIVFYIIPLPLCPPPREPRFEGLL